MSNVSDYSIGLLNMFAIEAAKAGFTPKELDSLKEPVLRKFRQVLLNQASITEVSHVIDCDANPFIPDGFIVEEHRQGGSLQWDPTKVSLYFTAGQKDGKVIQGNELRKEMTKKSVMNANVLDYLLANPHLIKEKWKSMFVSFWGTIYRNDNGLMYVRYLYWSASRWRWSIIWLGNDWHSCSPAAVFEN